jgi:hypothetical protein
MIEHFSDTECYQLVLLAADILKDEYGEDASFPIAEIIDCAWDQSEYTVYLTPAEDLEVSATITRNAYYLLGLPSGASDGTSVTAAQLAELVKRNKA